MFAFKVFIDGTGYEYTLMPEDSESTRIICEPAKIDQLFLNEDIVGVLQDLPSLILAEKDYKKEESVVIRFRVTGAEKQLLQKKALQKGYKTMSQFLRKSVFA